MNVTVNPLVFTPTDFPNGTQPAASIDCRLMQGTTTAYLKSLTTPFPTSVTFSGVAPGDYVFTAQALDALSHPVGAQYSQPLNVPVPPPVSIPIPTGATITVS